jgi:UDP-N-acetylglucosamine--N-acetylmuramyl-(pentapeptide) pyrophosphoryl-undecaprenol N-acetylglucosamine transferase
MKIVFSGGATGGHFYPIIAIAEALYERTREKKVLQPKLYFMAPSKYNPRALFDNNIEFIPVPAGKLRRYFSFLNIIDLFKTGYGVLSALFKLYSIYPDVVFGKGGYGSFPAIAAARILGIPVVIHESDSHPGRVNAWAGKFAKRIAVAYPEAAKYFDKDAKPPVDDKRIAFTGMPVRRDIKDALSNGARQFLHLEEETPVIVILGGSQGSQIINETVMSALPELLQKYEIIHQTGKANIDYVRQTASVALKDNPYAHRYHPFDYLNDLSMRMCGGVAEVIVSRAGSTIFEIASWGVPSIIIPLPETISHDQVHNAFSYARAGGCTVIEEHNLGAHILLSEIDNIVNNQSVKERMRQSAKHFSHSDAAAKIADVLLEIGLEHE